MASSIQPISPAATNTDTPETTAAAAPTATARLRNTVQAAGPQDTVTISAQASAVANRAVAHAANGKATPVVAAPASATAAPNTATPANATSSALALEQHVQQLTFQGLSANQIAANLNIPLSEVQVYLTGTQAAAQTAPAPAETAGINNTASAATTPSAPRIQVY